MSTTIITARHLDFVLMMFAEMNPSKTTQLLKIITFKQNRNSLFSISNRKLCIIALTTSCILWDKISNIPMLTCSTKTSINLLDISIADLNSVLLYSTQLQLTTSLPSKKKRLHIPSKLMISSLTQTENMHSGLGTSPQELHSRDLSEI